LKLLALEADGFCRRSNIQKVLNVTIANWEETFRVSYYNRTCHPMSTNY